MTQPKRKYRKRRKRTNSNVPAKGRLREMADRLWSQAIREKWDWRCAVCGHRKTEAHHLIPRQHQATRYDLRNGIGLCPRCHKFDEDISPHQNAFGWIRWLSVNHPSIAEWVTENDRPKFEGTVNADYYVGIILGLKEVVSREQFEAIVGAGFANYLTGD